MIRSTEWVTWLPLLIVVKLYLRLFCRVTHRPFISRIFANQILQNFQTSLCSLLNDFPLFGETFTGGGKKTILSIPVNVKDTNFMGYERKSQGFTWNRPPFARTIAWTPWWPPREYETPWSISHLLPCRVSASTPRSVKAGSEMHRPIVWL